MLLIDHGEGKVGKPHVVLNQSMGADQGIELPGSERFQQLAAGRPLVAAGQQRDLGTHRFEQRPDRGKMLLRQDLRRRHHGRLPSRADGLEHGKCGDHGLAAADVTLQETQHAHLRSHISEYFRQGGFLAGGQLIGQAVARPGSQCAVGLGGDTALAPHVKPHQGHGQLIGQQFVIGQPAPRGGLWRQIRFRLRHVSGKHRLAPRRPALTRAMGGCQPIGQRGQAFQCRGDGAGQRLGRQPLGQAVDRFDPRQAVAFFRRADMVGMGHLNGAPVMLDLAGDDSPAALGQHFAQPVGTSMEKDQFGLAGLVRRENFIGQTAIGRRDVFVDVQHHGRDSARRRILDQGLEASVYQALRQVPEEINDMGAGADALHQPGIARADAGQAGERLEQGIQDFGPHGPPLRARMADRTARKAYILRTPSPPVTNGGRGLSCVKGKVRWMNWKHGGGGWSTAQGTGAPRKAIW